jgi:hypothetical protein
VSQQCGKGQSVSSKPKGVEGMSIRVRYCGHLHCPLLIWSDQQVTDYGHTSTHCRPCSAMLVQSPKPAGTVTRWDNAHANVFGNVTMYSEGEPCNTH